MRNFVYTLITDPRIFNYTLITLYSLNIGRWALAGNWGAVWYWAGALIINSAVTWGFKP